jgi:predicted MFS family arabinose efflux permease
MFMALALTLGIAFTTNFIVFEVLSVLIGIVTCVSQILNPLTADLARPERRASALAILIAGVLLAILYARTIAGIIAQFVSWRVVYYLASGLQGVNLVVLYFVLPDYPVKNKGLSYWNILFSVAKYSVTEPQLIQASLVCMVSMACFTNFWVRSYFVYECRRYWLTRCQVTLTFLLAGPPYHYSTYVPPKPISLRLLTSI